jgi:PBP1b-binding outer membrane lipoprotein LpoB
MKKITITFITVAALGLLATGCSKAEEVEAPKGKAPEVTTEVPKGTLPPEQRGGQAGEADR